MKFKDLLEFACKEIEGITLKSLGDIVIEGLAKKDNKTIVLGSGGEFHYLYATPFLSEKEKVFYWADRFEEGGFDKMLELDIPEGYWVYFYQTCIDFWEFRYFETLEDAEACYDNEKFGDGELLVEKALMYLSSEQQKYEMLYSEGKQ